MGLHNRALIGALAQHRNDAPVEAVTPHGTFTFEVVSVEGDIHSGPVLRLVQVDGPETPEFVVDAEDDVWARQEDGTYAIVQDPREPAGVDDPTWVSSRHCGYTLQRITDQFGGWKAL